MPHPKLAAGSAESSQVKIPKESSEVFDRYNTLQKGQGYDLSAFAGKSPDVFTVV